MLAVELERHHADWDLQTIQLLIPSSSSLIARLICNDDTLLLGGPTTIWLRADRPVAAAEAVCSIAAGRNAAEPLRYTFTFAACSGMNSTIAAKHEAAVATR